MGALDVLADWPVPTAAAAVVGAIIVIRLVWELAVSPLIRFLPGEHSMFVVNPWRTGSRFIISHRLLTDETYVSGLRDVLGEFRARALLILDEAHHAAPAGGSRYAISSQFTKAVRNISERAATTDCGFRLATSS